MKEIEKDKHGFTVTKHKFTFRLVIKFLLTAAVCVYALYRCSLRACADEITLTPEQTFALIGSGLSGQAYNSTNQLYLDCYANYVGCTSSDFVPPNQGGNFYNAGIGSSFPTLGVAIPNLTQRRYLCYAVCPLRDKFAVGFPSWTQSDSSSRHDFTCNFPFSIQSCTQLQFSILYSASVTAGGYYGNVNNSTVIVNTNSPVIARHPIGQANINSRFFLLLSPFYKPYNSLWADVPENNRISFAAVPLDYQGTEPFSISGFSMSVNMLKGILSDSGNPFHNSLNDNMYFPLIYIQCPTISDYVPSTTPPVTTRPPATAYTAESKPPSETVDLSYLESGVAAIVQQEIEQNQNLDWIGNNMAGAVNNLALISWQLDRIYSKMWENGEVPLNAGLQPPSNESLMEFMQSALATNTNNAQSTYNLRSGMSTYFDIGNSLLSSPLFAPFVLVAAVGLALAVIAFVLFRGY